MLALPAFFAVTTPFLLTAATAVSVEYQLNFFTVAFLGDTTFAVNLSEIFPLPRVKESVLLFKEIFFAFFKDLTTVTLIAALIFLFFFA